MRSIRRSLPALAAAAALAGLAGCDMNEYYVTQSAGGGGTSGEAFSFTDLTDDLLPNADRDGAPDVLRLSGSVRADSIVVTLTFVDEITPWSGGAVNGLDGFVDFDTDESTNSGIPAAVDEYGGSANMGADWYVSLRDANGGNRVALVDAVSGESIAVPARFAARAITFTIPRSVMDETDGTFRMAAVVGHRTSEATDFAPNAGHYRVAPR